MTTVNLASAPQAPALRLKKQGMLQEAWRRLKKSTTAMIGLVLFTTMAVAVLLGPLAVDPLRVTTMDMKGRFLPASAAHPLGTDGFGRDLLARILYGGRISLLIGFGTSLAALAVGGSMGLLVGYYGGRLDNIIMRFVDILSSIPPVLLALAIVSALGCNLQNLMVAIAISAIPSFIRVIRAAVLNIVNMEYIEAARACGTRDFRIVARHLLPNVMGTVIVQTTMSMANLLLQAASLSFVGLGIQPPNPEWGAMLSEAREFMRTDPRMMLYPGLCIVITTLSLSLLGDGLRDAFDPRLRT